MKRIEAIAAIKAAGIVGDEAALLRLYMENRVSYTVALAAYREGAKIGRLAAQRERRIARKAGAITRNGRLK